MHRRTFAVGLLLLAARPAAADDEQQFQDLLKRYADVKASAKKQVLARFASATNEAKAAPGVSNDARLTLMKKLAADKAAFEASGVLSSDVLPGADQLAYAELLGKAYLPAAKLADAFIGRALQSNDLSTAELWQKRKADLDGQLPGRSDLAAKTTWNGTLSAGVHNLTVRLTVNEVTGNVFTGRLAQNLATSQHPIFEVAGEVNGNQFTLTVKSVVQGNAQQREYSGYLLGDRRLAMNYAGVVLDKVGRRTVAKPVSGVVVLHR